MTLLLVIMLLASQLSLIAASCPENQEPSFCYSNAIIPQLYCPGVNLQERWQCKKRSTGSCVCGPALFRRADGACVPQHECDVNKPAGKPAEPTTQKPKYIPEIPEGFETTKEDFDKVLKILQSQRTLYLAMAIVDEMPYSMKNYGYCLKSVYISDTASGSLRTFSAYKNVELLHAHISLLLKQVITEFEMLFDESGSIKMTFNLDQNDTIVAEYTNADLRQKFIVLDATEECLLVTYGSFTQNLKCLLWVTDITKTEETSCFTKMQIMCSSYMTALWGEGRPCKGFDAQEKGDKPVDENPRKFGGLMIPTVSDDRINQDALKFLQTREKLYLQKAGQEWETTDCLCIVSSYLKTTTTGCERTLECYVEAKRLSLEVLKEKAKAEELINVKENLEFRVNKQKGETSLELVSVLETAQPNIRLSRPHRIYKVLEADVDCLLVSYQDITNGAPRCLLWGTSREEVNNETHCYNKLKLCPDDMYDLTEAADPCDLDEESLNLENSADQASE
uniref:Lipocalin n=1 Tax=Rhipicephalus appendiculatus TaxID=34631 RepID=A0A131YS99_RHIAP